jgi:hypothetical protein
MRTGVVLLLGLTACAVPGAWSSPTARLGSAEAAAGAAARAGAAHDLQASKQLGLARSEIMRARERIKDGEYDAAESLLLRAEVDAEFAAALSREARLRTEADAARARVAWAAVTAR